jgi:hypothetical protein
MVLSLVQERPVRGKAYGDAAAPAGRTAAIPSVSV